MPRQRGERHWNWKGGRFKSAGYVLIYRPEHPRATKDGYVREHILVVETLIGRHLVRPECVHHINGNKSDNRPENLALMKNAREHFHAHYGRNPKLQKPWEENSEIECACGCGGRRMLFDKDGRRAIFIHGHNAKSKRPTPDPEASPTDGGLS